MAITYGAYDAKARFSEILRRVQEGQRVVITLRGKSVAEIRPVQNAPCSLEERLREMEDRGELIPAQAPPHRLGPVAKRPGALKRFLASRD